MTEEKENIEQNTESPVTNTPEKRKNLATKIITYAVAFIAIAIITVGVGIFRFGWTGTVVNAFQSVVPYPVAVVEWRLVSKSEFEDRFRAFKQSVEQNQEFDFSDPANAELVEQQKHELLDRMIELRLEDVLASRMGITVSDEEISGELAQLQQQTGLGEEELETLVSNMYGWTVPRFVEVVLVPQLREQKLQSEIVKNTEINKEAFDSIKSVEQRLNDGEDFGQLAEELSQDTQSAPLGGDLGWAPRGLYVPEFETAAFALEPGQRTEIITTPFGYHIAEMIEKGTDEDTGAEQFHIRHILIASKDFYQWLDEQKTDASIWKVVNI